MYPKGNEKVKWIGLVILVLLGGWIFWRNQQEVTVSDWEVLGRDRSMQSNETLAAEEKGLPKTLIGVHAAGAVFNPGVYFLPENARVVDLLRAAGGVQKNGDLNQINLAQPLMDGQKVVVPEKVSPLLQHSRSSGSSSGAGGDGKINLNIASSGELQQLPGVGPSRAEAIIQYREEHGFYRKIEELTNISGIGEKTFAKLKNLITVY